MTSYVFCPISERKINERTVRISAVLTLLILLAFIFTQNILFIAFLAVDFLIRALPYSMLSPLGIVSRNAVKFLPAEIYLINAGPKIFAARIGALLSGLAVLSTVFALNTVALVIAAILGIFSFLEGIFGICIACKIYPYLYKFLFKTNQLS